MVRSVQASVPHDWNLRARAVRHIQASLSRSRSPRNQAASTNCAVAVCLNFSRCSACKSRLTGPQQDPSTLPTNAILQLRRTDSISSLPLPRRLGVCLSIRQEIAMKIFTAIGIAFRSLFAEAQSAHFAQVKRKSELSLQMALLQTDAGISVDVCAVRALVTSSGQEHRGSRDQNISISGQAEFHCKTDLRLLSSLGRKRVAVRPVRPCPSSLTVPA